MTAARSPSVQAVGHAAFGVSRHSGDLVHCQRHATNVHEPTLFTESDVADTMPPDFRLNDKLLRCHNRSGGNPAALATRRTCPGQRSAGIVVLIWR